MSNPQQVGVLLPIDLMSEVALSAQTEPSSQTRLLVPDNYEDLLAAAKGQSEVLGIQRLLTLARSGASLRVSWQPSIAKKVFASGPIYPLLAVLLLIQGAEHWLVQQDGEESKLSADPVRRSIARYRLAKDFFADSEIIVCADNLGEGLPADLYETTSRKLRNREDFETLVVDALSAQRRGSIGSATSHSRVNALGVILAELFENTDMHAKLDLNGKPLKPDSIRGLMLKRVVIEVPPDKGAPKGSMLKPVECFEISVFDSGIGYYPSYTRQPLEPTVGLKDEWKVLHNCLERHYYPELNDGRAGHRAMGLYEVLRAIQSLKGRIEIRTGRLYAYRTFLDGQIQAQMQPMAEMAHLAWPKPRLLDVEKKYVAVPSEHDLLVGTSVRVVVPLD
eukprot:TRINITY_DN15397_c0_g1_i11.p1 TRINITY_DN15397_c0_g1~~TRINITY_DN15397_c0_g1_i11.p1  ORF type:complete len:392 (+),score=35.63 TRINITY_DN15397_c0_g1_i11:445-1620(+)